MCSHVISFNFYAFFIRWRATFGLKEKSSCLYKNNDSFKFMAATVGVTNRRQGIFWILTIPGHEFTPYLPPQCRWIRGQLEVGEGGFIHWQLLVAFSSKKSLSGVRSVFGPFHAELSRSSACDLYVFKDQTSVPSTRFELGEKPVNVSSSTDWQAIWDLSISGDVSRIPASIRFRCYRTISSISADYAIPVAMERSGVVYWGPSGTGKSRRAWSEAGMGAYSKDPRSKFWCGYTNQEFVIIDEFRGCIDIGHLLRWLDRYPVYVEIKGGSRPLKASKYWITSNLEPKYWYPDLDDATFTALMRRLEVINVV